LKVIEKHIVKEEISGIVRASDYIHSHFEFFETKSAVKKVIKKQRIRINGNICLTGNHIVKGQIIEFFEEEPVEKKIFELNIPVVYEDDFIAVINKPAGISVSGNYFKTVQNALPYNLKKSNEKDALIIPVPVHRLDNQTSGLLLIAKTRKTRINLGKQFEEKKILKKYNAVVVGKPSKTGEINFRVNGKAAFTKFECIRTEKSLRNGHLSLLNLYPLTGRKHQLRIHCEKSGFPILGDTLYHANLQVFKGKGLFLSAVEIAFNHPFTDDKLHFTLSYPQKFNTVIEREKKRFDLCGK